MDEVIQNKKCQVFLHYLQHQALGQAVNCHVKQISRTFSIVSSSQFWEKSASIQNNSITAQMAKVLWCT
jgi:hypothetical protein